MTVEDLLARITSQELSEWMAYFQIRDRQQEQEMEVRQKQAEASARARREAGG